MKSTDQLLYTRTQAADVTGFSVEDISKAINRGDLRAKRTRLLDDKPTGPYRITRAALDEWIETLPDA